MNQAVSAAIRMAPGADPETTAAVRSERAAAYRFVAAWACGWAAVGFLVAGGIAFTSQRLGLLPILLVSILFAEVVGFTALTSARLIFPFFIRLPFALRLAGQILTLASGTLFGSIAVLMAQPLFTLARPRTVGVIVLVNAVLAVVVGIALHTYDTMRRQIEASYRALREKEALERDLAIAREVQRELLPRGAPEVRGLELTGVCLAAVGVGGDLYDFLPLAEDRVGLVIADVSGKGIPAALLMAGLQASMRSLVFPVPSPAEINRRLNDMLYRSTAASRYATLFLGLFDGSERSFTYSNAGHYPPLHLGSGGTVRLSDGGIPIGLLPGATYRERRVRLQPGDLLVLYTDGVIEAPGPDGEEFGERRLLEVVSGARRDAPVEIVHLVLEAVSAWRRGAPPHDDVTLVVARVT